MITIETILFDMQWISFPFIQSRQSRPFYRIGMYRVWCNWHYLNDRIITDNEEIEIRHALKAWSPRCLLFPSLVLHTCVMGQLHATVWVFLSTFIFLRFEFGQGHRKRTRNFSPTLIYIPEFFDPLQTDFWNRHGIWPTKVIFTRT